MQTVAHGQTNVISLQSADNSVSRLVLKDCPSGLLVISCLDYTGCTFSLYADIVCHINICTTIITIYYYYTDGVSVSLPDHPFRQ